jgi:hypothetical protein
MHTSTTLSNLFATLEHALADAAALDVSQRQDLERRLNKLRTVLGGSAQKSEPARVHPQLALVGSGA